MTPVEFALLLMAVVAGLAYSASKLWHRRQQLHARTAGLEAKLERTQSDEGAFTGAVTELRSVAAGIVSQHRVELRKLRIERERLERSR